MGRPRAFNLLLVKGDGTRLLRLTLPRWTAAAAAGVVALVAVSLGLIWNDYLSLRQQRGEFRALSARVAEQQALLALSDTRIREVRQEIDGWRDLHARIWEPFGPDAGPPARRAAGVGGPAGAARDPADTERGPVREELERLASLVREEGENLRSLERFLARAGKVLASLPSRWPLRGSINSDYGKRTSPWTGGSEFHGGLDIGAPVGTPVRAAAPGTVVFAGRQPEFGITVIIDHGNDTKSLYGHLSRLHVAANQAVRRGDVIALTGNTGRSSGPHLHYEIQVKGQAVNPHTYIWEDPLATASTAPAR